MSADKQQIALAALQKWADENMVGLHADALALKHFENNAKRIVAETLDVEPEAVHIENLRYDGDTLALDGFEVVMP